MNIKRVWAAYFSPTGGTKRIVRLLADTVAEQLDLPVSEDPLCPALIHSGLAVMYVIKPCDSFDYFTCHALLFLCLKEGHRIGYQNLVLIQINQFYGAFFHSVGSYNP